MPTVQLAGGVPKHVNGTTLVATTEEWHWTGGRSNYIWFENTGAGAIVLSFTRADSEADVGVSVAAGAQVLLPAQAVSFYTKAAAAPRTFQAVVFIARG
jgi:hypothetical protein